MPRQQEKYTRVSSKKAAISLREDKPGGGLTDFGAKYRIEKNAAIAMARQALVSADGDVDKAAGSLDISPSALRYYLDLEPSLEKTKEKEESRAAANEGRFRKIYYDMLLREAEEPTTATQPPDDLAKKIAAKLASAGEGGVGMLTRGYGPEGISIVLYKTHIFAGNVMASLDTEAGKGGDTQAIADATEKSIVGMITLDSADDPCNDAMVVKYIFSKEGFGPTLYEIAMQMSPSGKIISDRTATSDKALNVYRGFQARGDIKKEPLDDISDPKTPQKADDCEVWQKKNPEREVLDYSYQGSGNVNLEVLKKNHKEAMTMVNRYTQKYFGWSPEFAGDYISQVADFMFTSVYHKIPMAARGLKGS